MCFPAQDLGPFFFFSLFNQCFWLKVDVCLIYSLDVSLAFNYIMDMIFPPFSSEMQVGTS